MNKATLALLAPILEAFKSAQIYLVGGFVRDVLDDIEPTEIQPRDIDLATNLSPSEIIEQATIAGFKVIPTGLQHGTVTLFSAKNNLSVEITTFRKPGESATGKTIEQDLSARDFTINAIAYDLKNQSLIDPFNGQQDLQDKILRAVGDPKQRFCEDPLRILRAIRFGPAQHRIIEPSTSKAITQQAKLLESIAIERIQSELSKILCSLGVEDALIQMKELHLLEWVLPELLPTLDFEQNEYHQADVFRHTAKVVSLIPSKLTLRLAALFHDIGKPVSLTIDENNKRHFYLHELFGEKITRRTMQRLKYSKSLTNDVAQLVKYHMRPLNCGPTAVRRLLRDLDTNFENWLELKKADGSSLKTYSQQMDQHIKEFNELVAKEIERQSSFGRSGLSITGQDLIQAGIPQGKFLGEILDKLIELIIENPDKNQPKVLIEHALLLASQDGDR